MFDVAALAQYYVAAEGVRSQVHKLTVVDVPYVQRLELEYHFPAYTGLEPQKIEDGGDIAVLRGTEVRLHVFPTMKTQGRADCAERQGVGRADAAGRRDVHGLVRRRPDGFYRVELDAPNGERVAASPQYTIDVLADQPPTVSFNRPGRDTSASPIEEVFVEANAEDDFGIRDLELVYSVNGGPEKVVKLFDGTKRLPEVDGRPHVLSRGARRAAGRRRARTTRARPTTAPAARSRRPAICISCAFVRSRRTSVRRSRRAAAVAVAAAVAGQVEALSEQQRQIISATFNVQRDRKKVNADKLRENSKVVGAVAGAAARAGRRTAHAHEQPARPARSGVREDRRAAAAGRDGDEGSRRQADARSRPIRRCRPRTRRCRSCRRRKRSTRRRSACSRAAAAVAAVAAPSSRSCPSSSSRSSKRWPAATRRPIRRPSRPPIARSTSCSRS